MLISQGAKFSTEKAFELAKRIEENGEIFYRHAAEACPEHRDFLLKMAEQEGSHKSIFEMLEREYLDDDEMFLKGDEAHDIIGYLMTIADSAVFSSMENPETYFKALKNPKDIFGQALKRESRSILFFLGIKEMMLTYSGRTAIDALIKQEMTHIAWIKRNFPA